MYIHRIYYRLWKHFGVFKNLSIQIKLTKECDDVENYLVILKTEIIQNGNTEVRIFITFLVMEVDGGVLK